MNLMSKYSNLVLENKLRQLADLMIENSWRGRTGNSHRGYRSWQRRAWADHMRKRYGVGKKAADDVESLTKSLRDSIQLLTSKYGMTDEQINDLVSQAMGVMNKPHVSNVSASSPDNYGQNIDARANYDASFANFSVDAREELPSEEEKIENPKWYDQMTYAEKVWFDKLKKDNPEAARQFIYMTNQQGNANLTPGSDEWRQAQELAQRRHKHWMQDRDATFMATAGLLNRQKVRKRLQKLYGPGGSWEGEAKPLEDFDDLLQKDHVDNVGKVFNEWCYLAGVKNGKNIP